MKIYLIIPMLILSAASNCMERNDWFDKMFEELRQEARTSGTGHFYSNVGGKVTETINGQTNEWPLVTGSGIEKIQEYDAQGINSIIISGGVEDGNAAGDYANMQLNIIQIDEGDNTPERLIIQVDDNILPYLTCKKIDMGCLKIGLHAFKHVLKPSRNIVIQCALKNYINITTQAFVSTTLPNMLRANELKINISGVGTSMLASTIMAKKLDLWAEGITSITTKKDTYLLTDHLLINKQGNSDITLAIRTNKLNVENNGNGKLTLEGSALEQNLQLFHGDFLAKKLESENIHMVARKGTGDIQLWAKKLISGTVSRNSNYAITYDGTPTVDLKQQ